MGVPHKRKAYDSVDPTIDDEVPSEFNKNTKKDFFEVWIINKAYKDVVELLRSMHFVIVLDIRASV